MTGVLHKTDAKYLLVLCSASAIMVFLYGRIGVNDRGFDTSPDIHAYRLMAHAAPGIDAAVPKPFAYRILGPFIAGVIPMPDTNSFYLCAVIVFTGLIFSCYAFFRSMGINEICAFATTMLLVLNRNITGYTIWGYFVLDDLLAFLELVWLFRVLHERRWFLFAIVLTIGALTRETIMLMIPVAFLYLIEKGIAQNELKKLTASIIPSIGCFIAIRLIVPTTGGFTLAGSFFDSYGKIASIATWLHFANTFVPLVLIPFIFIRLSSRFFKERKYMVLFILLVFASALFGGDNERLIAPAFAVVYLLIAHVLQEGLGSNRLTLGVLLCAAFATTFNHIFARYPIPRNATIVITLLATIIVTVYVYLRKNEMREENIVRKAQ